MLRTNIIGGILITALVLFIVGFGISLKFSLDWSFYFKILSVVGAVALAVSVIVHLIPSRN
ncbi:MAG: hypothetical protein OXC97_04950 [Candidatus Dadabacteria bacterium]|nr:hypothetical protein [Candidatus Dadabacteria bacterium]